MESKPISPQQYQELPEEQKQFYVHHYQESVPSDYRDGYNYYTPVMIPLAEAIQIAREAYEAIESKISNSLSDYDMGLYDSLTEVYEALTKLKSLNGNDK